MTLFKEQSHAQPPSGAPALFWREVIRMALIALAYWITVRLGLLLVAQPENIASVWPASGLALAILLLYPKSNWSKLLAIIFFTNAIGNWSGGNSLPVSLGFALANTLEPFIGAWVVTHFCKTKITFARTIEIVTLLLVATLINGITALLGAAVSMLAFHTSFVNNWLVWWAADGLGIILVTPFIITWGVRQNALRSMSPLRLIESVLFVSVLAIFAWLLFGPFTVAEQSILRNYMIFPLLIWLAFRFSQRSMANALLLFSAIAIWNTLQGFGIFAFTDQTQTERLVSVQIFLSVITFSGLLLSAIVTQRKQTEEALIASKEKWLLLVKAIPDYVSLHDSEGRFLFLNHYAEGFSEKDVIGSSVFQYLSPQSSETFKRNIENCHSTKTLQKFEHTAMGDHSVMREYEDYVIPIIEKNEPAATLLVSRDITERKQAEDELRRAKKALTTMNIELQTALAREKQLARTDALTGVKNRRYLFELAEHTFDVATRYQQPLSVMMIDIDHFKEVNDIFGHALGDQILQRVAQSACAELRSADIIGRYGGDEFVIVLPITNARQAYPLAERIRESVAAIRVPTSKRDAAATLSIGIAEIIHVPQAEYSAGDNTMDDMLRRADEAMYSAKQAGRNCTVINEK